MSENTPVGTPMIVLLFIVFVCLIAICGYVVIGIWPPDCLNNQCVSNTTRLFFWSATLDRAENLLVLVAAMGALGALIHVTSSFADYVGNRQLILSWVWWLLLRVPIGIALSIVFYMLIRGGLIIPNGSTEAQINPYGIAGLSALIGMFAKQATDKLADIFDNLFRSDKYKVRSDPLRRDFLSETPEMMPPLASSTGSAREQVAPANPSLDQERPITALPSGSNVGR